MKQTIFFLSETGNSMAEYLADHLPNIGIEYDFVEKYPIEVKPLIPIIAMSAVCEKTSCQMNLYLDDFRCPGNNTLTTLILDITDMFIAAVCTSEFYNQTNDYNLYEFYISDPNDESNLLCIMEERIVGYENNKPIYKQFFCLNEEDKITDGLYWPITRGISRCEPKFA